MGTNYYLMTGRKKTVICDCGFEHLIEERPHIGKSSYGRYFTMHRELLPDGTCLGSLKDWQDYIDDCPSPSVIDEYGRSHSQEEMWKIITREDWSPSPGGEDAVKKGLIGKPVDPLFSRLHHSSSYDEWGERGFVKSHGSEVGNDGLYIIMDGDFS